MLGSFDWQVLKDWKFEATFLGMEVRNCLFTLKAPVVSPQISPRRVRTVNCVGSPLWIERHLGQALEKWSSKFTSMQTFCFVFVCFK